MSVEIIISPSAKADIRDIYEYISFELVATHSAKRITNQILDRISLLGGNPEMFPFYPEEPLYSKEIRFFPVEKYLVFYKFNNNKVKVGRIIYGGRSIPKQITNTIDFE